MNPSVTNPPVATPFFFYLLAATMVIGGILVITRKNAVHSAMALITALLAQAGLYLMLYAPFVAGVQIILYAGGIMVLFLFVIMLINLERNMKERQFNKQWLVGIAAAAALGDCSSRSTPPRQKAKRSSLKAERPTSNRKTPRQLRRCCSTAVPDNTCSPSKSPPCSCWSRSSEQ
jgi:NADH:ubiquinone oxidoreductase subunit 6 (subunit J)